MFGGDDSNNGNQNRQGGSGGGFDIGSLANMAQSYMSGGQQQGNNSYGNEDENRQSHSGGGGGGFDFGQLSSMAQNYSSGNHDSSLFSNAASFLQGGNHQSGADVNEQELLNDQDAVHNQPGSNSAGQIGNAAVISAIKSMLGGGNSSGGGFGSGGGSFQQKLIGAAMSHAADLYDKKDGQGQAEGSKQDAVNQAGQMAMKLAMKNPSSLAGLIGGGNSGGLGALMGMLK